jgi:hypothetical protein
VRETDIGQHKMSTAARRVVPAVQPLGEAGRPGSFWQRWKEWERRTNGAAPAAARPRVA